MALAVVLAVTLSVTVVAGGAKDPCVIGNITHKVGDTNLNNAVNMGDVTVCIKRIFSKAYDLELTSDGCCPIEASWTDILGNPMSGTVPAGETKTFYSIDKDKVVQVSADDSSPSCVFDSWSDAGAQIHDITMDSNKCVTATCYPAFPEPCCWCIYEAEWWALPNAPPAAPTSKEYIAWHTEELLPPDHLETGICIYDAALQCVYTVDVTIPVATYHQELKAYEGAPPNGYTDTEWLELLPVGAGVDRTNPMLGPVKVFGYGYWIDQSNRINWKSRYDLVTGLGAVTIYSWTLAVIPGTGTPGFPYALGDSWITIIASGITTPTAYFAAITGVEMIDCGGHIPALQCFKNESFIWQDLNGIDDDLDGATDEDWFNGYDDDGDGDVDEDGGDGVPNTELDVMTPSGVNYVTNAYPCPVKVITSPGQLYNGYENRCLIWVCQDPPFLPWQ